MQAHLMLPPTPPEMQLTCGMPLSPGGACTPNGASTLGLPTGLLTGAGMQCWLQWLHPWLLLPVAHQA